MTGPETLTVTARAATRNQLHAELWTQAVAYFGTNHIRLTDITVDAVTNQRLSERTGQVIHYDGTAQATVRSGCHLPHDPGGVYVCGYDGKRQSDVR